MHRSATRVFTDFARESSKFVETEDCSRPEVVRRIFGTCNRYRFLTVAITEWRGANSIDLGFSGTAKVKVFRGASITAV